MEGLGVMIGHLGGNEKSVEAYNASIGKVITSLAIEDDQLKIGLGDTTLRLVDDGQSCCENRYMSCDDDLTTFIGSTLSGIEIREGGNLIDENEYGDHETEFLIVTTSSGVFTCCTHNEHNGYYGGFWIQCHLDN